MVKMLRMAPSYYWKLGENRVLRPMVWDRWLRRRMEHLSDTEFTKACDFRGSAAEVAPQLHDEMRLKFFFHPRNQKDFFLNLLTSVQPEESILSEARKTLDNIFSTLGSGEVSLGANINWQRDFKSGKVWDLLPPSQLDIVDLDNPSDVKVPWEVSRFHQVWWLGKAYWLTHDERYAVKFGQMVENWILHNPPGIGVNWANAMEPSIRAINWIAGYYLFCESRSLSESFWLKFFKSLYVHGVFVRNHLEYSWRSGNHLLSDLVGLVVLGILFRHASFGKRWLKLGIAELESEMVKQVHADGVDYEQSTSYQRLVTELLCVAAVLCRRNNVGFSKVFMDRLEHMMEFIQHYLRPDGSIPLFGDADDGRLFRFAMDDDINDHRHILAVGAILFGRRDFKTSAGKFSQDALWLLGGEGFEKFQMLGTDPARLSSRAFPEGGFYIMRNELVHLTVDAGGIGMGGMGGHGHNDTLSFEYWVDGAPLVVDSGTYAYTFDVESRQQLRSTKSHNTIVVDGKEIATFVGLWMILNDSTHPHVIEWKNSESLDVFEGMHHAYDTLPSPVRHRRRIELEKSGKILRIIDRLEGLGNHTIESYLHFAPSCRLTVNGPQKVTVTDGRRTYDIDATVGEFSMSETWFSRSYGVREKKMTLRLLLEGTLPLKIETMIMRRGERA